MNSELDKSVMNDIDGAYKRNRKKTPIVSNLIVIIRN